VFVAIEKQYYFIVVRAFLEDVTESGPRAVGRRGDKVQI
jgi:hypothetical protein